MAGGHRKQKKKQQEKKRKAAKKAAASTETNNPVEQPSASDSPPKVPTAQQTLDTTELEKAEPEDDWKPAARKSLDAATVEKDASQHTEAPATTGIKQVEAIPAAVEPEKYVKGKGKEPLSTESTVDDYGSEPSAAASLTPGQEKGPLMQQQEPPVGKPSKLPTDTDQTPSAIPSDQNISKTVQAHTVDSITTQPKESELSSALTDNSNLSHDIAKPATSVSLIESKKDQLSPTKDAVHQPVKDKALENTARPAELAKQEITVRPVDLPLQKSTTRPVEEPKQEIATRSFEQTQQEDTAPRLLEQPTQESTKRLIEPSQEESSKRLVEPSKAESTVVPPKEKDPVQPLPKQESPKPETPRKDRPVTPPPKDREKKIFGIFKKSSSSDKKRKFWQFWK